MFAVSMMVPRAVAAAETLKKAGIGVTVIDPRTLSPLDENCLLDSVKKTGRLVVAEPGCKTAGIGAEIAAIVAEKAITHLDSPVVRVASPDFPAPFSQPLLDRYIPTEEEIVKAVKKTIN